MEIITARGRRVWVRTIGEAVRDSAGRIIRVQGAFQDISERKHTERRLRQQADELRARNEALARFNDVAVGRELRMVELKREVNELCGRLGESPRHRIPAVMTPEQETPS
jgi:hypothetical protein